MSIKTGNPIGLLLALTYTVASQATISGRRRMNKYRRLLRTYANGTATYYNVLRGKRR